MLCCALATGAQTLAKLGKVNIAPKQETIKKNNMELLSTYSSDLPMVAKKTRAANNYAVNPKILTNNAMYLDFNNGQVAISETVSVGTYYNKYIVSHFGNNNIRKIHTVFGAGTQEATVWIKKNINGQSLWETTLTNMETNKMVSIDCDYELDGEGFFLGYTATGNFQSAEVFFTENTVGDNTLIVGDGRQWQDFSSEGSTFFLCETEGDYGLPKNDIVLTNISLVNRAITGEKYNIVGEFVNFGYDPVMSYNAKLTIDGKDQMVEVKCDTTGYMGLCEFSIPGIAPEHSGRYESILEVTEVNGEPDTYASNNIAECELIALSQSFPRKAVMEALTGTWCGWCPRGAVAIENLKKDFPNDFIAIAIHGPSESNDPFKAASYMELADAGSVVPSAILNRTTIVDTYYGFDTNINYGIKDIIEQITQLPTEAQMGISSTISDDETELEVTSYIRFALNDDKCPYKIAYVLIEDNLTGVQTNYYSSQVAQQYGITEAGLPADLKPLYQKKYQYVNTFEDVARGIYDYSGIEGSLSGSISKDQVKTHTCTINLPANIKNINNVSVVALLFDNITGEIIAAEKANIGETVFPEFTPTPDTPNYEPRHNGTKTNNYRPVTAVKLIGESSGEHVYTLTSAEQNKDYTDVTASVVFKVYSGERLTPNVEYPGIFMNHAVYIDTDKNGFTGAIEAGSEWKPAGDLVSYSFYNNGAASDLSGWNSVGDVITGDDRMNPPLPDFTAPTQPGIYRMRFVQDWCSIDPAGDNDGKYGDFKENGGQIIDVMIDVMPEVLGPIFLTDGEDYTNTKLKMRDRITYTREFKNTEWQAWYVPFDIDYDAISEDFTAASLNAVHQYDDDDDGVFERWTLEILKLKSGDVIRANMPYMIRAKETGEHKFVVENAILYSAEENSLDCSSIRVHYTFKGNYSLMDGQVLRDNGWFAPGGGSLVTPSAGSNLKAYRWLLMPEARGGYETFFAPKRINIVIGDEEEELTAIEEVPLTFSELWPADVYDLNGRLVKAQAENLNNLPKGIYLVNGKKIVK